MEIKITDDKIIQEIQQEFRELFPFLKIEFYIIDHKEYEGSPPQFSISNDKRIGTARTSHKKGYLSIHGNMNVGTLEKQFRDLYGLNVQVFRKSGDVWIQTTSTDDWSLSEQNIRGKESQ